jgi:hypothetical protein
MSVRKVKEFTRKGRLKNAGRICACLCKTGTEN